MKLVKFSLTLFALVFALLAPVHADENHPGIVTELVVRSGNDWTGSSLPPYLTSAPEVAVMRFTIPPQTQMEIAGRKKILTDEHSGRILVDSVLADEEREKMEKIFAKM